METLSQKEFYWREFPWNDPLVVLQFLRQQKKNPLLLYSGKSIPDLSMGHFSFLPFLPEKTFLPSPDIDFFNVLGQELFPLRALPLEAPLPFQHFCGGLAGFFSYDFAHRLEKFAVNRLQNPDVPEALLQCYEQLFAFDHFTHKAFLGGWFETPADADEFFKLLNTPFPKLTSTITEPLVFIPEISAEKYSEIFSDIQKELHHGNSYQVNFSQKWSATTPADHFALFQKLVEENPAPMMCFLEHEDFALLSCSPERLFSLRENTIFTQPIAGTRGRGKDAGEDAALATELGSSDKEMAEHTMLVDLLRNDCGRVASFGSVQVTDFARVEQYASVMHLVSDIQATLDSHKTVFDLFIAMFPGGTITGAPKRETMDILGRLEPSARGAYCGSAGYFSFHGAADFNILIRTLQCTGNEVEIRAGGGIVLDSDPTAEYRESLQKANGIIKVLGYLKKVP